MAHPKLAGRTLPPMIIMGVSGSGKSTIGLMLSESLDVAYVEGDSLHATANVQKMGSGEPLDDEDRRPWLRQVAELLRDSESSGEAVVVACSALKRSYREVLTASAPSTVFVHLDGSQQLIAARLSQREHAYMPPELLESQLKALESLDREETSIVVDIDQTPADILVDIELQLVTLVNSGNSPD